MNEMSAADPGEVGHRLDHRAKKLTSAISSERRALAA
jgi:hypothetical protein